MLFLFKYKVFPFVEDITSFSLLFIMFIHVEFLNTEQSRQLLFQIQLPDKTDVQHFVQRLIHYLEPAP